MMEKKWLILTLLAGMVIGERIGFQRGYEEGLCEEQAVSFERSDCYCSGRCCEDHNTHEEDLARTHRRRGQGGR